MKLLKKEIGTLYKHVLTTLNDQDIKATESNYTIQRVDRMYRRMKNDITRHETLCYELATKFEQHHNVMAELGQNIDSIKNYTLINDLHMEAYQPIQTATIAYEVSKALITSNKQDERFKKHFVKRVLKDLELNCVDVCNPSVD